jgi:hypothetical protein
MVADVEGETVFYINGMRLNRLRAIPKWLMSGRKLTKPFDRLKDDPDSGFIGTSRHSWGSARVRPSSTGGHSGRGVSVPW